MKRKIEMLFGVCMCFALLCSVVWAEVEQASDVGEESAGSQVSTGAQMSSVFPDVPTSADYFEAVNALYEIGIVTGDENGNFNPNSTITRAEVATMICRLQGVEDEAKSMSTSAFTDLPKSHWANGYVAKAAEMGIINGHGNGKFEPESPVTCEQMLKMLVCAWGWGEQAEEQGGYPDGYVAVADELGFTDGVTVGYSENCPRKDVAMLAYEFTKVPTSYEVGGVVE